MISARILQVTLAVATLVFFNSTSHRALAQDTADQQRREPATSLPMAALQPDPAIPTIAASLGYDWAEEITSHRSLERYMQALADAAPDRARLIRYGTSYEGRALYYLVISSSKNIARLEQIRASNLCLADPRRTGVLQAGDVIRDMPAVVWLASSVHGNELSSTEAAMLTSYHLLADQRTDTRQLLQHLVVIIDPLQNPDGRERFVNVYRETRGAFPSSHPLATEHTERWPGGRSNHYLFDMNRDWFLQSQQETVHKVRAYLRWQPQIYVDSHEMGRNSTYFFVPPTDPINPFMLPKQQRWLYQLGEYQAAWFDRYGFAYTTREIFDAFFPGYGSEWPTLQGGLGILWEQAGVRGLVIDRDDETKLQYREAVLHHYVSSLATLHVAAERRERLLSDFYDARARGVQLGEEGPVRHFFLLRGTDPSRAFRLARLLRNNGIEVRMLSADLTIEATDVLRGDKSTRRIPRGSFQVPVAQGAGRLVRALLDREVEMDAEYIEEQLRRKNDYLPDQIYDVTAWSLPLAFDVACLATDQTVGASDIWNGKLDRAEGTLSEARVAYLVRPTDATYMTLCQWLQRGLRVHVTGTSLTLQEESFPPGTLILQRQQNGARLHQLMQRAVAKYGLDVTAADTGFVTKGAHFGGPNVKWIRPPKIALAVDRPARYSVGHTWHLFDQQLRYPTTRIRFQNLSRVDLDDFNVLVLPDGSYSESTPLDTRFAERAKEWVREGGTLVLIGGATAWGARDSVELAQLTRVCKPATRKSDSEPSGKEEIPKRWPDGVPGAFVKATLFQPHWLTFGQQPRLNVFVQGSRFFEPIDPENGRSVVHFASEGNVLASGFCWPETAELLPGKTYLAYFALGQGHVVAFAGDPNYRAMFPSLQRLFINAVLLGPGQ
jgi:hypothetical protein